MIDNPFESILNSLNNVMDIADSQHIDKVALSAAEEEKIAKFMSSRYGADRIAKFFRTKERTELGIVYNVENLDSGKQNVYYLNEDGGSTAFGYNPEIYLEAPNGYEVGDAIFIHYPQGSQAPDIVRPVKLGKERTEEILERIKEKYDEYH